MKIRLAEQRVINVLSFIVTCWICQINVFAEDDDTLLCEYSEGAVEHLLDESVEYVGEKYRKCPSSYCYAFWEINELNETKIMGQGCWTQPGRPTDCHQSTCIASAKKHRVKKNSRFCCCVGNLCNSNFTEEILPEIPLEPQIEIENITIDKNYKLVIPYFVITVLVIVLSLVTASVTMYYCWAGTSTFSSRKADIEKGHYLDNNNGSDTNISIESTLNPLILMDKIGEGRYGTVWRGKLDDKDVAVKLFKCENRKYYFNEKEIYETIEKHPSILQYFCGGEYMDDSCALVLSLEPQNLQQYLSNNVFDAITLGKMASNITTGLTYLHSDINKPCIAHRDINPRNILVREDLSCCICDLGLAIIPGGEAIKEAGTLRYMAPEVLEGAVNLNECAAALKQVDVYALALVLWEMGRRCKELQDKEPPEYEAPFYSHTGPNVTLEEMQNIVSRDKMRPSWPETWKNTPPARMLRDTVEDCWDQDGDARLTAICVSERFYDFPHFNKRISYAGHQLVLSNKSPTVETINNNNNNNNLHDNLTDASSATVETLLSPSEDYCKNSNQSVKCAVPLEPTQGRNPCLEKNPLVEFDENLIDKSCKHASEENLISYHIADSHTNSVARIPFLQNAIQNSANIDQPVEQRIRRKKKFPWKAVKKLMHPKQNVINETKHRNTEVKLKSKIKNVDKEPGVTTSLLAAHDTKRPSNLDLSTANPIETNNYCGISQLAKRSNSFSPVSLHQFNEVFSSKSDLSQLKDVSQRVKTPGDVPPSVRRTRGNAASNSVTFRLSMDPVSLDQDILTTTKNELVSTGKNLSLDSGIVVQGGWGSVPALDPSSTIPNHMPSLQKDYSGSMTSF